MKKYLGEKFGDSTHNMRAPSTWLWDLDAFPTWLCVSLDAYASLCRKKKSFFLAGMTKLYFHEFTNLNQLWNTVTLKKALGRAPTGDFTLFKKKKKKKLKLNSSIEQYLDSCKKKSCRSLTHQDFELANIYQVRYVKKNYIRKKCMTHPHSYLAVPSCRQGKLIRLLLKVTADSSARRKYHKEHSKKKRETLTLKGTALHLLINMNWESAMWAYDSHMYVCIGKIKMTMFSSKERIITQLLPLQNEENYEFTFCLCDTDVQWQHFLSVCNLCNFILPVFFINNKSFVSPSCQWT